MTKTLLAASVAALALASVATAEAAPAMRQAGTVACTLNPGVGLVFGSARGVACTVSYFDRRGRLHHEGYAGRMDRAGIDLGLTSDQQVTWAVMAPGGRYRPGMLAGAFGGSSSDASVVVGAGTRSLLGQSGPVALREMGSTGQVGLGIGFGTTALSLQQVPNGSYASFRY